MTGVIRVAVFFCVGVSVGIVLPTTAWAVTANPLQSAYWRFEEGTADTPVAAPGHDQVPDSINENHLDAATAAAAPTYVSSVPPTPLKSGAANSMAMVFAADDFLNTTAADDAPNGLTGKKINNGIIEPGNGFTLEAAFKLDSLSGYQAIVVKDGRPNTASPLPTFVLKVRGDTQRLQVEQIDGGKNAVSVLSTEPMSLTGPSGTGWYYAAVVNDGSQVSLYLDSNDGNGYLWQGSAAVEGGAIYQGGDDPDGWSQVWAVGRGQYNGGSTDYFNGIIDEVRLYNRALDPADFLFAPPTTSPGDYNGDGTVDAADYVLWRDGGDLKNDNTLGNQPGDYIVWRENFGNTYPPIGAFAAATVPEPASWIIGAFAFVALLVRRGGR